MTLTVIGGGGMRTPLLIGGLIERHARLPVERVVLHDVDPEALELVAAVSGAMLSRARHPFEVRTTTSLEEALEAPSWVITSIRVGGLAGRVVDEQVPLAWGVVGQETTGPGGWAMALRTIPVLADLAVRIQGLRQFAWIINFTNPAGLITQALTAEGHRVIGICDGPPALGDRIAAALGARAADMRLDYLGLNHLGWVRGVQISGAECLPEILASNDLIRAIYGRPLFDPEEIRRLGLLPNEYLHYYYHHDALVRRLRASRQTRGEAIGRVAAELRRSLKEAVEHGQDPVPHYQAAIFARRSSYMAAETGAHRDLAMMGGHVEGGYARAALGVIAAMLDPSPRDVIVNTANRGAIEDLGPEDVVEVPCRISASGPTPRPMGPLPASVRELVLRVKAYERATVAAAARRSWHDAVEALAMHPLVPSSEVASGIAEEFRRRHSPHLDYLT
ncbi:MAG: 6-phospho-beta-glucosidase [Armatimonadetes bacterium]|nr:6-phospho-beta-glucosidase [Armatimonadota bacterium]